jgi:L-ribulokinase
LAIVAGVDFGTLSVRVSIFDSGKGRLGSATSDYPLFRKRDDPDHATQRHADHMDALASAMKKALQSAGVPGESIASIALDTTGSTIVPLGPGLIPLDDYYVWCDHRAKDEAAEITAKALASRLPAIDWCGGVYSSEWGWAKLLHWLRHNPQHRDQMVTAVEHCDMVAAILCGIDEPSQLPRSICAMGHKWMWNDSLGGMPPEEFFQSVDPLLAGARAKTAGRYATSDTLAGTLCTEWASRLGLRHGIPIPVGAFDAHWDAIGAGVRFGDVVNVVGTSTCIMAISENPVLIPGVCGVVPGSIHPRYAGIEAGLSACGDIFDAIAKRAGQPLSTLSESIASYRAGQTGLLRMSWDNGDRTVLVNPNLGGVTLGWNLVHTAADELFASIEGTAFHTRIILERMAGHGTPIHRVINGGGIPQKNDTLNRVYANVLNKPVLVPESEVTSLGSAIFAFLAAKAFPTVEAAQDKLCPKYRVYEPDPKQSTTSEQLFQLYRKLYFALGDPTSAAVAIGDILPALRRLR